MYRFLDLVRRRRMASETRGVRKPMSWVKFRCMVFTITSCSMSSSCTTSSHGGSQTPCDSSSLAQSLDPLSLSWTLSTPATDELGEVWVHGLHHNILQHELVHARLAHMVDLKLHATPAHLPNP
ncbi:hypothetical protein ACFX1Z_045956 [Malus domestica]